MACLQMVGTHASSEVYKTYIDMYSACRACRHCSSACSVAYQRAPAWFCRFCDDHQQGHHPRRHPHRPHAHMDAHLLQVSLTIHTFLLDPHTWCTCLDTVKFLSQNSGRVKKRGMLFHIVGSCRKLRATVLCLWGGGLCAAMRQSVLVGSEAHHHCCLRRERLPPPLTRPFTLPLLSGRCETGRVSVQACVRSSAGNHGSQCGAD